MLLRISRSATITTSTYLKSRTVMSAFTTTARMASAHPPPTQSNTDDTLLTYTSGNLFCIELNRPKALNALTLPMCQQMNQLLDEHIDNPDSGYAAFLVKSNHPKAFCAGGDIKAVWQEVQQLKSASDAETAALVGSGKPGYLHTDFFRDEYVMNHKLSNTLIPQISVWDGIVMGGGVGLSLFGEFRIATEKTMFAMPETGELQLHCCVIVH